MFITYLTFALPFSTWVMVTYLRGLPRELEEAARIDGASSWRMLTRIVVPLSWPGIVVSAIFAFLLGWNDVLFASVHDQPGDPDGRGRPAGVRGDAGGRRAAALRPDDGRVADLRGARSSCCTSSSSATWSAA